VTDPALYPCRVGQPEINQLDVAGHRQPCGIDTMSAALGPAHESGGLDRLFWTARITLRLSACK